MTLRATWAGFGLVLAFAASLGAASLGAAAPARADSDDPSFLTFGLGYYDITKQNDSAADFRLEYRHGEKLWIFKPWVGVEATSDGAFYGAAGVLIDVYFGKRVVLTPSFGAGFYAEGDGKDLGHEIEFRSQIELAYRFDDRSRLGVAFSHISNASIGDKNPGVEILNVYYSLPLDGLLD
ncbi:MAG: acyloxyacyl hydrolase [Alphaproteobacteria bacterium]